MDYCVTRDDTKHRHYPQLGYVNYVHVIHGTKIYIHIRNIYVHVNTLLWEKNNLDLKPLSKHLAVKLKIDTTARIQGELLIVVLL